MWLFLPRSVAVVKRRFCFFPNPRVNQRLLEGRRSPTTQCRRRIARFAYAAHTVPSAVTTGGTRRRADAGVMSGWVGDEMITESDEDR